MNTIRYIESPSEFTVALPMGFAGGLIESFVRRLDSKSTIIAVDESPEKESTITFARPYKDEAGAGQVEALVLVLAKAVTSLVEVMAIRHGVKIVVE